MNENKITVGEGVTFLTYARRNNPSYRVFGKVIKVNRVNMIILEDMGGFYKRWNVFKNKVRRSK